MRRPYPWPLLVAIVSTAMPALAAIPEPSAQALLKEPSWQRPEVQAVKAQATAWLEQQKADAQVRSQAEEIWSAESRGLPGDEVLGRLVRTFALVDENVQNLVDLCSGLRSHPLPPSPSWLSDPKTPPLVARNMRLLYGIWLVQESLLDEAQAQLADLTPEDVVDPASLLFYQSVVSHRLLAKEPGLKAIQQLLERTDESPRRYTAVACLMQEDLKGLKEDSLDHIARRMEDIERRLDLGRAGPKVRKIEDGVIESLDKLIKKLEEQQQQQQQQASAGSNTQQPSSPAPDSRIVGGKGPGEVTKKSIGDKDGWGNLPPKQREEAMQQIGREFPPHYRDAVEQYFRKLATEGSDRE